jgi:hypothetical protein
MQRLLTQKVKSNDYTILNLWDNGRLWFLATRVGVSGNVELERFNGVWNFCTLISLHDMVWIPVGG